MFRGEESPRAMAAAWRFVEFVEYQIAFVEAHKAKK